MEILGQLRWLIAGTRWVLAMSILGSVAQAADIRYAHHFTIESRDGWKLVTVRDSWRDSSEVFNYALISHGQTRPADLPAGTVVVEIPVRRFVTLSTTILPHLPLINRLNALIALGSGDAVCDPEVRSAVAAGKIASVNAGAALDLEKLVGLRPDLVMANSAGDANREARIKLAVLGLPLAVSADFMEETPLGKSEWIKFTAVFFGPEAEAAAEKAFCDIEQRYKIVAALTANVSHRPTVFTNAAYGGIWYISGGQSFMAAALHDAGARYVWEDDRGSGGVPKDFEVVYARARKADVWINPGRLKSRAELLRSDDRYGQFRAYRDSRIYNSDLRIGPGGGNDIFELGVIRPDLVLSDLIWIFHPELEPHYEPTFFRQLE